MDAAAEQRGEGAAQPVSVLASVAAPSVKQSISVAQGAFEVLASIDNDHDVIAELFLSGSV